MPTKITRFAKPLEAERRGITSKLQRLKIQMADMDALRPTLARFALVQTWTELARVHDLPNGQVAVSLMAKLIIIKSGVMFTDVAIFPQWDDCSLDLEEEPQEHPHFEEFTRDSPAYRPTILNRFLVNHPVPLRTCQREGLIIATGWNSVPLNYPNEKRLSFTLCLTDELGSESRCTFYARVDRSLKAQRERQRPDPRLVAERIKNRVPLFSDQEKAEAIVHGEPPASSELIDRKIKRFTTYRETM